MNRLILSNALEVNVDCVAYSVSETSDDGKAAYIELKMSNGDALILSAEEAEVWAGFCRMRDSLIDGKVATVENVLF